MHCGSAVFQAAEFGILRAGRTPRD